MPNVICHQRNLIQATTNHFISSSLGTILKSDYTKWKQRHGEAGTPIHSGNVNLNNQIEKQFACGIVKPNTGIFCHTESLPFGMYSRTEISNGGARKRLSQE